MSDKTTAHPRRKNRISGQFAVRLIEMLESPAYRALSVSAHRVISRIEIELASHGGNDNGKLPVTYQDFIAYGIARECIAPALREVAALGFIECTKQGRGGNAEYREPSLYRLTFAHARDSRQRPPTDEWRRIKSIEEAEQIARAARANKSSTAIELAWADRLPRRQRLCMSVQPDRPLLLMRTRVDARSACAAVGEKAHGALGRYLVERERNCARSALNNAVGRGEIVRPATCEQCGNPPPVGVIQAHHADYSKPLDVQWLCPPCHAEVHKRATYRGGIVAPRSVIQAVVIDSREWTEVISSDGVKSYVSQIGKRALVEPAENTNATAPTL